VKNIEIFNSYSKINADDAETHFPAIVVLLHGLHAVKM